MESAAPGPASFYGSPSGAAWANLTAASPASAAPRSAIAEQFAYDPADGYYVLFGGFNESGYVVNDTWVFQAGKWSQLHPARSPPDLYDASMVWDPIDGYLLLFGGSGAGIYPTNETWSFRAGNWTLLHPLQAPSARYAASMTWDERDGYVLLFGGVGSPQYFNDTWSYIGGEWTNLTVAHAPEPRRDASIAFDSVDGSVVLFGGWHPAPSPYNFIYNDTWTYSNGSWTNLSTGPTPSPRWGAGLAEFGQTGDLILYGGASDSEQINNQTWYFRSGDWSQVDTPSTLPPEATGGFAAGTPFQVLMFGGASSTTSQLNTTWLYYAINLTVTPGTLKGDAPLSMSFDASATGGTSAIAVEWSFGDGINASGSSPGHVYRDAGNYTVSVHAADGLGVASNLNFTIQVLPQLLVSASAGPEDGPAPLGVMFNAAAEGGEPPYVFVWTPTTGVTLGGPSVIYTYPTAGTYTASLIVTDALNGSVERNITIQVNPSVTPPPALSASASANRTEGEAPLAVQFNAFATGGTSPYTFAWDLGGGVTSTSENPSMVYATPGTYEISLTAGDSVGDNSSAPDFLVVVLPHVSISPLATVTSGSAPLTVFFTSSSIGGLAPYTVIWSFGDGGSGSGANFTHTFTTAGTFNVTAEVVDADGGIARGSVQVTVAAGAGSSGSAGPAWYASSTTWTVVGAAVIGLIVGGLVGRMTRRGGKGGAKPDPPVSSSGPSGSGGS